MGLKLACRVLLIYPRFVSETFWNFAEACELMGARYPAAPLGLITVAAMLPPHWEVRLVDRNTEDLTEADLAWADMVMTGGMLPQQADTVAPIELCRRHDRPVVVGGPDATSSPHIYKQADFRVLGEAAQRLRRCLGCCQTRRHVYRAQVSGRRDQEPDAAFRPTQPRILSLHWRSVFTRLSVHL